MNGTRSQKTASRSSSVKTIEFASKNWQLREIMGVMVVAVDSSIKACVVVARSATHRSMAVAVVDKHSLAARNQYVMYGIGSWSLSYVLLTSSRSLLSFFFQYFYRFFVRTCMPFGLDFGATAVKKFLIFFICHYL